MEPLKPVLLKVLVPSKTCKNTNVQENPGTKIKVCLT